MTGCEEARLEEKQRFFVFHGLGVESGVCVCVCVCGGRPGGALHMASHGIAVGCCAVCQVQDREIFAKGSVSVALLRARVE